MAANLRDGDAVLCEGHVSGCSANGLCDVRCVDFARISLRSPVRVNRSVAIRGVSEDMLCDVHKCLHRAVWLVCSLEVDGCVLLAILLAAQSECGSSSGLNGGDVCPCG